MVKVAEPVAAVETDEIAETLEVVIISGPRKGEIVRLSQESVPEVSDEEIELLNQVLDDLIAAIDRVSTEIRLTTEAVRERVQAV